MKNAYYLKMSVLPAGAGRRQHHCSKDSEELFEVSKCRLSWREGSGILSGFVRSHSVQVGQNDRADDS